MNGVDASTVGGIAVVLGALGGVLKLFLDFVRRQDEAREKREELEAARAEKRDKQWQEALEHNRKSTEKFLGNHMSNLTRSSEAVARTLAQLADEVRRERAS